MTRGKKPRPAALRVVGGKEKSDGGPIASTLASVPAAPAWLCKDGKAEWARVGEELHLLGMLSSIDLGVMAAYCNSFATFVRAMRYQATLEKVEPGSSLMAKAANGTVFKHPVLGAISTSTKDMVRFAAEMGMTPSARSRINIEKAEGNASKASKYFNRKRPA